MAVVYVYVIHAFIYLKYKYVAIILCNVLLPNIVCIMVMKHAYCNQSFLLAVLLTLSHL